MLLRAILSTALGTVGMTLSSTTEMKLRGRPESTAPGQAANKVLRLVGVPKFEGRALEVLSTWTHWVYGTAWGVVFWLLIDVAGLPLAVAGIAFFFIVWVTEQVQLPLLGVAPPPWRWGIRENVIDAWHHIVYAATTVLAWVLLGIAS
ncbi:MAG: DUF1440 domain-containing protein [Actinomycetota bacterium]|nr:DUF1440 domain-containing protein [Actinomycetota bacterium]